MKPYVESGREAQRNLAHRDAPAQPTRQRLLNNLRAFKQVINTIGVAAIAIVPTVGVITHSAVLAALTAGHFLLIICILEMMERGVKRELVDLDTST